MDGMELISFQIISSVGAAKSAYIEAMQLAKAGKIQEAKAKIKDGETLFVDGHRAHAKLVSQEASGEKVEIQLLLMHAEDQLMSSETIKIMAEEIIDLHQKLLQL